MIKNFQNAKFVNILHKCIMYTVKCEFKFHDLNGIHFYRNRKIKSEYFINYNV